MARIILRIFIFCLLFSCSQTERKSDYLLHVVFDTNQGLTDRSKIHDCDGKEIGAISHINNLDSKTIVTIRFDNFVSIPIDSDFELFTASLIGDKAISVHYGKSEKIFTANDTIYGQSENCFFQGIENILNSSDVKKVDSIDLEKVKSYIDTVISLTNKVINHISN